MTDKCASNWMAFAWVMLIVGFCWVSEQDYRDQKRIEAEKLRLAEVSPPKIWSRRCEERGQTMIAKQADGGKWVVVCTGPRTTKS